MRGSERGARRALAVVLCALAGTVLSGCGLASSVVDALDPPPEALTAYVDAIDDSPGIRSIEITRGSLVTVLEPSITREQFDAFAQRACDGDAGGPVSFDLSVTLGEDTTLSQIGLDQCWTEPVRLIEAIAPLSAWTGPVGSVTFSEYDGEDGENADISFGADVRDETTIATDVGVVHDTLAAMTATTGTFDLHTPTYAAVGSFDEVTRSTALAADLVSTYPVDSIVYDHDLAVGLDTVDASVVDAVRSRLATTYPDVPVRAVFDSSIRIPPFQTKTLPSAAIFELAQQFSDTGRTVDIWIDEFSVRVTTTDPADAVLLARLAERSDGPDSPSVIYQVRDPDAADGDLYLRAVDPELPLLQDLATVTTALHATGQLGEIEAQGPSLDITMADDFPSQGDIAAFSDRVRQELAAVSTTWTSVTVQDLPLS
jgi:hypothetical protein